LSSLTEQERIGLEEVFLSISGHKKNSKHLSLYQNLKNSLQMQRSKMAHNSHVNALLKKIKNGIKLLQFAHITHKSSKTKK
jgi:hypothetical protein